MDRTSSKCLNGTPGPSLSFHGHCFILLLSFSLYIYTENLYSAITVFPKCTVVYFYNYYSFYVESLSFHFSASPAGINCYTFMLSGSVTSQYVPSVLALESYPWNFSDGHRWVPSSASRLDLALASG